MSQLKVNKNEPKTDVQGSRTTRQEEAKEKDLLQKLLRNKEQQKSFGF